MQGPAPLAGGGQQRPVQGRLSPTGQDVHQARQVDLGHPAPEHFPPEPVGVDHIGDFLARTVAHGQAGDQRHQGPLQLGLGRKPAAVAVHRRDHRPQLGQQGTEPGGSADPPRHENHPAIRGEGLPDLHLHAFDLEHRTTLGSAPIG